MPSYAKIKTKQKVKFEGPLETVADWDRLIKFATGEREALATASRTVKVKREPAGTAEFLEGTNTK